MNSLVDELKNIFSLRLLFSNSFFLFLNTLIGSGFGYIFWVIFARVSDPEELGKAAALISAIALIANLSDMGLGISIIRFFPSMDWTKKVEFLNSSFFLVGLVSLVLSFAFLISAPLWTSADFVIGDQWIAFLLFISTVACFSVAQFFDRLFIATEQTRYMLYRNLIYQVLRVSLVFIIVPFAGAFGVVVLTGLGALISFAIAIKWFSPKVIKDYSPKLRFSFRLITEQAKYTFGNYVAQILWNSPALIFPLIVIGLMGPVANGQFYTSWMIANLLYIVPISIATSAFASYSNNENKEQTVRLNLVLFITILLIVPFMLGIYYSADYLMEMFGDQIYNESKDLLIWLLLSVIPYTVNYFVLTIFRLQQKTRQVLFLSVISVFSSLAFMIYLVPIYNLNGVGISWLLGQVITLIYAAFSVLRNN